MNIDNVNAELLLSMKEDVRQAYEELHSKGLTWTSPAASRRRSSWISRWIC